MSGMMYFLAAVLLWVLVKRLLQAREERMTGGGLVEVPHDHGNRRWWYNFKMTFWHGRVLDRALVCNMHYRLAKADERNAESVELDLADGTPARLPPRPHVCDEQVCDREEFWTNASNAEIMQRGYRPAERLHDTLAWLKIPTFMIYTGAYRFEVPPDKDLYPQHTPALMDDKFESQSFWGFVRGMATRVAARELDVHGIVMVLVIVAGAVGGLWMMGFI